MGKEHQSDSKPLCSHPKLTELMMVAPACIYGYERTWSIEENKLYLVDLKIHLEHVLSEACEDGLLFADWFTGNINFGQGNIILRGLNNRNEEYLLLLFENGVLVEEQFLTYDKAYPPGPEES